jgi:hypothetical protein
MQAITGLIGVSELRLVNAKRTDPLPGSASLPRVRRFILVIAILLDPAAVLLLLAATRR